MLVYFYIKNPFKILISGKNVGGKVDKSYVTETIGLDSIPSQVKLNTLYYKNWYQQLSF